MSVIRTSIGSVSADNDEFKQHAQWTMNACQQLGDVSQSPDYVDRRYLTKEHKAANILVAQWMRDANMQTWQDGVGNLWGRLQSVKTNAKTLLFGSHLDTVVNGGKYDGMLGVVAPIALVNMLNSAQIQLPFNIDIVGFCDEEGTRFGSTLLGSRALTGQWQPEWADLTDLNGITLRQAMQEFGLDFDQVDKCKVPKETLLAYVETHIEQGPVLEANNLAVGTVTAIAGAKRLSVNLKGMAGHAGTVPMQSRQDALAGASEMILAVEKQATLAGVVSTVGKITNRPNAVNVISGDTEFSLDIRSDDDSKRDACLQEIISCLETIAGQRVLTLSLALTHQAPAVLCSTTLIEQLDKATSAIGISPLRLLSGAGHDAMAMADICPVGMLFVRCEKGISHHPKEAISTDDIETTLRVLYQFVLDFNLAAFDQTT